MLCFIGIILTSIFAGGRDSNDCPPLYPKVQHTETMCFIDNYYNNYNNNNTLYPTQNQTMVLMPVKTCNWWDIAIITEKESNRTVNYFKVCGTCWYQNNHIDCTTMYPGVPVYQKGFNILYDKPDSFKQMSDYDKCVAEYHRLNEIMIAFALCTGMIGVIFIMLLVMCIGDYCNEWQKNKKKKSETEL